MITIGDLVQMDGFPQMRGIVVAFGITEHGDSRVVEVYNAKSEFRHRFLLKDLIKIK
jgi:hypothetical protein